jgi:predicted membrane chloride channel (bestrophin family)
VVNEHTFRGEWSRIVADDREVARRVRVKIDQYHEREKKIAVIREVARQAGERAVKIYLEDLAAHSSEASNDRTS